MREYVNFRMRAVGYRGPDIFRGGAYRRMAKASEGLTRRINILADKALLAAFAEDTFDVGKRHVSIAINDSQFVRSRRWGLPELSLISGLVLIVAAVSWTFVQRSDALGEGLQRFLPGGAAEEIVQPAANAQPASPGTLAETTPESSHSDLQAPASAAAGEQMASAAGVADSGAPDAAASVTQVQGGGDERDAGIQAQSSQSAQSTQSAMTQPAVADGGSRLVLSDTLSNPPQTESRAVAEGHSPAAVDEIEMPSDEAPQSSPTPAMPNAESVAVVPPGSGAAKADQVASSIQAPAAVETPVKTAQGVGPLTEARMAATRDWLESVDNRNFSIQLLLTDFARRANLETFLRERQSAGDVDNYYVFETRIRSNIWYGVLYKEYASFGAAKAALEELPEEFRYHQPFIRNVRDIATLG
jgi:septal ring-binding cell division protein DamX